MLGDRRGVGIMTSDSAPHLVGAFVAQVYGAEHQDRGHQPRRELTEEHCGGQDQQQLVAQGSDRDAFDDGQLALGSDPVDVLRCHRGVINDHSGGLGGRAAGGGGQSCENRDVVEESEKTRTHRVSAIASEGTLCCPQLSSSDRGCTARTSLTQRPRVWREGERREQRGRIHVRVDGQAWERE